jgi:hypothetical protein
MLSEEVAQRNIAAHPFLVNITQHQADDVVTDLVNDVVLKPIRLGLAISDECGFMTAPARPLMTYRLADHVQMGMAHRQIGEGDAVRALAAPEQTKRVRRPHSPSNSGGVG